MKDWTDTILTWVLWVLIAFGLFMFGFSVGGFAEQQAAMKAGAGRWTIDPKTGIREFAYGVEATKP